MSKVLGKATYSAYRENDIVHVTAEGDKPTPQTKVTIEPLPFLIYPPIYALYFESSGTTTPVVVPFLVERAIANFPSSAKTIAIEDATGHHSIPIQTRAATQALLSETAAAFCVFQHVGTARLLIAPCDAILPAVYTKVFGPASYAECQQYAAAHGGAPAIDARKDSFKAWIDYMPGGPPRLIVIGDVTTEPTVGVQLVKAVPQGINPTILILDLILTAGTGRGGTTPAVQPVRYEESPPAAIYTNVTIRSGTDSFAIPVTQTH